jgi:hypothetical protein
MSATLPAAVRFHRLLEETAVTLQIAPEDLAGRFGLRRFAERYTSGDAELLATLWLHRTAHLRKEARAVSRALTDSGVRHFFFKGIALVGRMYALEDRRLDDMDLMIDPAVRNAALATLHALGYVALTDPAHPGPAALRPGATMYRVDPISGERDSDALLDVHWGLEPVTALLPDDTLTLQDGVWSGVEIQNGLPVLQDEHHLALILHHLVRHDLAHVRGILDFALLWESLPKRGGAELTALAERLGVSRALSVVGRVLVDDLGVFPLLGVRLGPVDWRSRAVLRHLRLRDWLAWAARTARDERHHVTVNAARSWRRYLLADDRGTAARLVGELVRPPREYLRWRWPEARTDAAAWRRHVVSLAS